MAKKWQEIVLQHQRLLVDELRATFDQLYEGKGRSDGRFRGEEALESLATSSGWIHVAMDH